MLQKSKKAMETNSHGLHYEETKKPWGLTDSPMAPFTIWIDLGARMSPPKKEEKVEKRIK